MEDQGGKTNERKSRKKRSNEKHKRERQPKFQSLPELLQTEKTAKRNAMANTIKANMKAVEKSNR